MRQIVLDTETTGLDPSNGHRIIEIGCVELMDRRHTGNNYHVYINPEREIDDGAVAVHGITSEFLADKPLMADVCEEFLEYVKGAELVIHNADFDTEFINAEFAHAEHLGIGKIAEHCQILDTLKMARELHPGQKNNLDALCKRYFVDNSQRDLHGALLDARILADVYLAMTGGQGSLLEVEKASAGVPVDAAIVRLSEQANLPTISANQRELEAHEIVLEHIRSGGSESGAIWDGMKPDKLH